MTSNPHHYTNNKENTAQYFHQHQLTPAQRRFVEATYRALQKVIAYKFAKKNLYGQQPDDIANFAIEKVIKRVEYYMRKHQSPLHAANAIATNAFIDSVRREWAQRGHGARGTRKVVGDQPINRDEPDGASIISEHDGMIVDPEAWIDEDHCEQLIAKIREVVSPLAFEGFVLTEIHGLTQAQAAERLGCGREHLNREMSKATKHLQSMRNNREEH